MLQNAVYFAWLALVARLGLASAAGLCVAGVAPHKLRRRPPDPSASPETAQCHNKCHACHAKWRSMWSRTTPATQNEGWCHQVPPATQSPAAPQTQKKVTPPLFFYILDSSWFFVLIVHWAPHCNTTAYCRFYTISCQKKKVRSLHLLRRLERMGSEDFGRVGLAWCRMACRGFQNYRDYQGIFPHIS